MRPFSWVLLSPTRWIYRISAPIDRERLHYYTALMAAKVLTSVLGLRKRWARGGGDRPAELAAWGSPHTVALLRWRLRRITGCDVRGS